MRWLAALAPVVLAAVVAAPASAAVEEQRYGYVETTICVVRTDPTPGYRVGGAIRAWNAAQPYVHLSNKMVPGCGIMEIRTFTTFSVGAGYADWPQWSEGEWLPDRQRWGYHHAEIWLRQPEARVAVPKSRACAYKTYVGHEMGHALGLHHTTGPESVMSYTYDVGRYCGAPSDADAAALASLYGPL